MRRPQLVIKLKDENAFRDFRAGLTGIGCPEESVEAAWKAIQEGPEGEYSTATGRVTSPGLAHAAKAMISSFNTNTIPPRQATPLSPGEFAVEFEHRRLEPGKVNLWFRSGDA